jgi:hypothetical protein
MFLLAPVITLAADPCVDVVVATGRWAAAAVESPIWMTVIRSDDVVGLAMADGTGTG